MKNLSDATRSHALCRTTRRVFSGRSSRIKSLLDLIIAKRYEISLFGQGTPNLSSPEILWARAQSTNTHADLSYPLKTNIPYTQRRRAFRGTVPKLSQFKLTEKVLP